jgi:hypothetical protein
MPAHCAVKFQQADAAAVPVIPVVQYGLVWVVK